MAVESLRQGQEGPVAIPPDLADDPSDRCFCAEDFQGQKIAQGNFLGNFFFFYTILNPLLIHGISGREW